MKNDTLYNLAQGIIMKKLRIIILFFRPVNIFPAGKSAEQPQKKAPHKCEVLFIFIRKNRLQIRITDLPP